MPEDEQSPKLPSSHDSPRVCESCRFGSGPERDCGLIVAGDMRRLLEEGPCELHRHLKSRVAVILKKNFPLVKEQSEDIYQDAVLRLLDPKMVLPGEKLKGLGPLMRWLGRFLKNHVIDSLRRQRIITRLRCGSCEHFSRQMPQRCQLEFITSPGGEMEPNPWWGDRVKPASDPRLLSPPCQEFEWRRPATFDIFDADLVPKTPRASRPEEAVRVCLLAIDRLASHSERGTREAAVISGHYLAKRTVAELATKSGVSEKTIKRLLASGRVSLLKILKDEFGLESPAELLA